MNSDFTLFSVERSQDSGEIFVRLRQGDAAHAFRFKSNGLSLDFTQDAFLAACLLPCMATGATLRLDGPASALLFESSRKIQEIFSGWFGDLTKIAVQAESLVRRANDDATRVGAFFSGGIDSYYTLLRHQDEITDLIFVHGYDIPLDNKEFFEKAAQGVSEAARRLGKNAVFIETDFRPFLRKYLQWGPQAHGVALAVVGHVLSRHFRRVYIPASFTFEQLFPWGSHPDLDPLWSTEALEFVHDGCDATRVQKIARVAQSPVALENLRVCFEQPRERFNCGVCEKCVRTMIGLTAVGAMEHCTTFQKPLEIANVRRIIVGTSSRPFTAENLAALEENRAAPELARALRDILDRSPLHNKILLATRNMRRKLRKSVWARLTGRKKWLNRDKIVY